MSRIADLERRVERLEEQINPNRYIYGLKAIAARFDVTPRTIERWMKDFDLPVTQNPTKRPGMPKRTFYRANERLLLLWELQRSRRDREQRQARRSHNAMS